MSYGNLVISLDSNFGNSERGLAYKVFHKGSKTCTNTSLNGFSIFVYLSFH